MLGDVGIIKRFRVFRNNNVFLHDKISELCERRRIKSIQESRMIHREGYQRHGDILNATDIVSPNREYQSRCVDRYSMNIFIDTI